MQRSKAVDALQSIIGSRAALTFDLDGEAIVVSNEETGTSWSFHPIEVGRLDRNRVAHRVNTLSGLHEDSDERPPLLVADHVTAGAGTFLRDDGISYLDAAGNCFVQSGSLLLFVHGQTPEGRSRTSSSIRAFQTAGLKLIFAMLVREDTINWTYRDLADLVGISQGTVAYVMQDLKELEFAEKRGTTRTLRKTDNLMDRWTTGYTERLRSNLSRGRFRFLDDTPPPRVADGLSTLPCNQMGRRAGRRFPYGQLSSRVAHTLHAGGNVHGLPGTGGRPGSRGRHRNSGPVLGS